MLLASALVLFPVLWLSSCLYDVDSRIYCPASLRNSTVSAAVMSTIPTAALRRVHVPALIKGAMPFIPSRAQSSSSTVPRFTYRLAAAAAGKKTPPRPPRAGRDFWSYTTTEVITQSPYLRSTKPDSGEDAFFAATINGSPHRVAFGVADGVGGWQDSGVDPSVFSHGLCGFMAGTAHTHEGAEDGQGGDLVTPRELLQTAYDAVMANPRIAAGGCTASLAVADGNGGMETANLGDSGFLILGPGRVSYRSEPQTHAFNTPYQLSKIPPKMQAQHAIFGGAVHLSEVPSQADVARHSLRHGDVVVFATDGVWDNLSAQDALEIVTRVMKETGHWYEKGVPSSGETMLNDSLIRDIPQTVTGMTNQTYLPALVATAIMREAKVAGLDRRRNGPFAKEVKLHYPREPWVGGKPDDIAVVVCVAVEDDGNAGKATTNIGSDATLKAKL